MSMSNDQCSAVVPEELTVLSDRVRVLTEGDTTQGRYEVFEVRGVAGGGAPPHRHPWDEEFHVTEGTVEIFVRDSWRSYRTGESVRVPAGVLHGFRTGASAAKFLAVTSPQGAGRFFRALHEAGRKGALSAAEVVRIASLHHVEGPSLQRSDALSAVR
jgi:quercetin dioxygenase-like cupin family protein